MMMATHALPKEFAAYRQEVVYDLPTKRSAAIEQYVRAHRHVGWVPLEPGPRIEFSGRAGGASGTFPLPAVRAPAPRPLNPGVIEVVFRLRAKVASLRGQVEELEQRVREREDALKAATAASNRSRISLQPTFTRLNKIADLETNWDSYGAAPPTARAVAGAGRLVDAVAERFVDSAGERARPWAVAPFSGGLQVEWRGQHESLEVEVDSNGRFNYLLEEGDGLRPRYEEGENVGLEEVLSLLSRVLGF